MDSNLSQATAKQWLPQIVVSGMLLFALIPGNTYGYYIMLRWVCCALFGYLAFQAHTSKRPEWLWVLGGVAAVYNPIIPLHLPREIWSVVNTMTIGIAMVSIYATKPGTSNSKSGTGSDSMTLTEAEHILDVVSKAFQNDDGLPYHRKSSLQSYDVFQFDWALKLRIANDFLVLQAIDRPIDEFDRRCNEWASMPLHMLTQFVPDSELDELQNLPVGSREYAAKTIEVMPSPLDDDGFKDSRFASLETLSSFGAYCKQVGPEDPMYWQKIYTRLELPYTSSSPRANNPAWELVEHS